MKAILLLILAACSLSAVAGSAGPGVLSTVHFMSNGVVIVYTSGARDEVPSCAVNFPSRFALDSTTPAGKTQVAGLLTAYASGKTVRIHGNGTCNAWGDTETIGYLYTVD